MGKTVKGVVWARARWNDLRIRVLAGQRYKLTPNELERWWDCSIRVSAAGYTSEEVVKLGASRLSFNALSESRRRLPDANWFALVCGLDDISSSYFVAGTGVEREFSTGGMLGCFANDLQHFYGNNSGAITLEITRLQ